jgi:uncharacterized protein YjbI with pentapeptide repeats
MTENVRKLVGVAAMAALVVVGVAVSSSDDTDFTRNVSSRGATSPSASADKAADCCDETLALLESMQDQLQTLLDAESEPAYVQLLEDQCSYTSSSQSMGPSIKVWDCSGAKFKWMNFRDADLMHTDFSGAYLAYANFAGADLTSATLTNADVASSNFRGAKLIGADFSGSKLFWTNFSGAMLGNADFIGAIATGADFSNADLSNTDFTDAVLPDANFAGANLRNADFTDADFSDTNFTGAMIRSITWDPPSYEYEKAKIYNE